MNKDTTIITFPGQGSQALNMGKELYDNYPIAKQVFEEVDDALNYKLSAIIFGEDDRLLQLTENAQPALMATSIAVLKVIEQESGLTINQLGSAVTGHSLGEYSALCAAGSLPLTITAQLLKIRGRAMNAAAPQGTGGMAALLGADIAAANTLLNACKQDQILVIANDNANGQVVISGHAEAIDRAVKEAVNHGIKRAIKLPVSGPFHSPLMTKAQDEMREALQDIDLKAPQIKFIANVTAIYENNPAQIKNLLVEQVTSQVRWREIILFAESQHYTNMIEMGSGAVLSGLTRRITTDISPISVGTIAEVKSFLAVLNK